MAKDLVLKRDKDVKGRDFESKVQFVYDQLFVEVNGFKIKVKAGDGTSKDMIHQALDENRVLVLGFEEVDGKDDEGKPFTYKSIFTTIDDDQVSIKALDRTGKNKIIKFLESNAPAVK